MERQITMKQARLEYAAYAVTNGWTGLRAWAREEYTNHRALSPKLERIVRGGR